MDMAPADYFELALLLGASFLVNYVTADLKTNWMEGFIMVAFYLIIVRFRKFPMSPCLLPLSPVF